MLQDRNKTEEDVRTCFTVIRAATKGYCHCLVHKDVQFTVIENGGKLKIHTFGKLVPDNCLLFCLINNFNERSVDLLID